MQTAKRKLGLTGALSGPVIRQVKQRKYELYKDNKANKAKFNQSQSLEPQNQQFVKENEKHLIRQPTHYEFNSTGIVKNNPLYNFTNLVESSF